MVDDVLEFLKDGKWYDFIEVAEKFSSFGLLENDVKYIISFLTKFGFVDLDEDWKRVRINATLLSFFQDIKAIE